MCYVHVLSRGLVEEEENITIEIYDAQSTSLYTNDASKRVLYKQNGDLQIKETIEIIKNNLKNRRKYEKGLFKGFKLRDRVLLQTVRDKD